MRSRLQLTKVKIFDNNFYSNVLNNNVATTISWIDKRYKIMKLFSQTCSTTIAKRNALS